MYLRKTGGKHDNFKMFADTFQKCVNVWSFQDVDFMNLIFNFYRNDKIWIWDGLSGKIIEIRKSYLERAVH